MKKPTVYVETSVISYLVAPLSRDLLVAAHQQVTAEWWRLVLPECTGYISLVVLEEISRGDTEQAQRRLAAVSRCLSLSTTQAIHELADLYLREIAIPPKARADAYHLAFATAHGVDYLASWNCVHIASGRVRGILERLNKARNLATPVICTPEELMEV